MSTSRTRRKTGAPGGAERPPLRSAHRLAVHPRSEPGAVRPERGALPGHSGFRLLCLPRLLEGTLSEAQGLRSPEGGGGGVPQRSAAHMGRTLLAQQTPGTCRPECVQDRNRAAVMETDRLLAVADYGPRVTKKTLCKVISATPKPWTLLRQVIPWALRHTRVCVVLTTRHPTGRSWRTRGGERKATGAWAAVPRAHG